MLRTPAQQGLRAAARAVGLPEHGVARRSRCAPGHFPVPERTVAAQEPVASAGGCEAHARVGRGGFLISCNADALANELKGDAAAAGHFDFRGAVASRDIQSLYDEAHVLVNLSDLESFSNNYMEAWKANVPLLVSDRDFAREICGESAIYCEPHNVGQIAERMLAFVHGQVDVARLVANGVARLRHLGNQDTRMDRIHAMLLSCVAGEGVPC